MTRGTSGSSGRSPEVCGAGPPRQDGPSGHVVDDDPDDIESDLIDLTGVDLGLVVGLDDSAFSGSLKVVLRNIDRIGAAVARYKPD